MRSQIATSRYVHHNIERQIASKLCCIIAELRKAEKARRAGLNLIFGAAAAHRNNEGGSETGRVSVRTVAEKRNALYDRATTAEEVCGREAVRKRESATVGRL